MASLERRYTAIGCLLAAGALHGCAFELRAIIVDDARAPDAVPADVRDDLPDAPVTPDATDLDALPDAVTDVVTPDAPVTPDTVVSPDVIEETAGCAPSRLLCGLECVDLSTDVNHCGACATRCTAAQGCVAGRCVAVTYAGAPCTMPDPMGGVDTVACGATLRCLPSNTTPWCTLGCADNASQAAERSMCGGGSSTCLTIDEGVDADSRCARACTPGAAPGSAGACRAGFICTGWWFTRASARSDTPGCAPFCVRDADCPAGQRCNVRTGDCALRPADLTRLPDGSPCDPTLTELPPGETFRRNTQCRGMCFYINDPDDTHGVCGSYVDLAASNTCPDDPSGMRPETSATPDDYGLCVVRRCAHNSECRTPLVCRFEEGPPGTLDRTMPTVCLYPTNAQRTGIP